MKYYFTSAVGISMILILASSCNQNINPPQKGFLINESDPKAIRIADEIMEAMGGRKAWDETRYIAWNFFGSRYHIWDKHKNRVRIESPEKKNFAVLDMNTMNGEVISNGVLHSVPDSIQFYLQKSKEAWINDSYWLVMPFKLKDSGVCLKYVKEEAGHDILELTFKGVGVTPQNKYQVYVDQTTKLIDKWTFFKTAEDKEARFSTPWINYKKFGNILLSGDRGSDYQLTQIQVFEKLPEDLFERIGEVHIK